MFRTCSSVDTEMPPSAEKPIHQLSCLLVPIIIDHGNGETNHTIITRTPLDALQYSYRSNNALHPLSGLVVREVKGQKPGHPFRDTPKPICPPAFEPLHTSSIHKGDGVHRVVAPGPQNPCMLCAPKPLPQADMPNPTRKTGQFSYPARK